MCSLARIKRLQPAFKLRHVQFCEFLCKSNILLNCPQPWFFLHWNVDIKANHAFQLWFFLHLNVYNWQIMRLNVSLPTVAKSCIWTTRVNCYIFLCSNPRNPVFSFMPPWHFPWGEVLSVLRSGKMVKSCIDLSSQGRGSDRTNLFSIIFDLIWWSSTIPATEDWRFES